MALPPCLWLTDNVFPQVRGAAARRLAKEGWSQTRTAEALGISQAMVSNHLAATVREPPIVQHFADELVAALRSDAPRIGPSAWCTTLTVGQERAGGGAALDDMLAAEQRLLATNPVRLVPQIGLNLARAVPGAKEPQEVLAFPARIVEASGRLLRPAAPSWGGSGHLARCLIHVHREDEATLALASVRGGPDVVAAARRLGWKVANMERRPREADAEAPFRRAAASGRVVNDPGAVGIEPCLYIAGPDAQRVADLIVQLDAKLVKT